MYVFKKSSYTDFKLAGFPAEPEILNQYKMTKWPFNIKPFSKSRSAFFSLFIVLSFIALDQIAKYCAGEFLTSPSYGGFLGFSLQEPVKNYNLFFGLSLGLDHVFINIFLTAVLCLLFFYYILSLVFLPKSLYGLRWGISLLFSGLAGNLLNKLFNGYVLDFIKWSPVKTWSLYFNLADILQTIAWLIIFSQLFLLKKYVFKGKEKRNQILIMKSYQLQFIGYAVLSFLCVSAFFLILNYQFVQLFANFSKEDQITAGFFQYSLFILFLLALFIGLFFLYLSNKIYGPVYAFERYIRALLQGKNPKDLKLRKNDQLKHLEGLAKDIKKAFNKSQP